MLKGKIRMEIQEYIPPYDSNPFQSTDGKWYWWDETEQISYPYDTKEEATLALNRYASWLNGGDDNDLQT